MSEDSVPNTRADTATLEAAAEWFALLTSEQATTSDWAGWRRWYDHSMANRQAWQYVEQVAQRFGQFADPTECAVAESALNAPARAGASRRRVLKGMGSVMLAAPIGWLAWRHTPAGSLINRSWSDHASAVGEIRRLALPDGSHVWLNTASAVNVGFDEQVRSLTLVTGEIFVATARDTRSRPLIVQTERARMEALGTEFSVRHHDGSDELAVLSGAVAVRSAGTSSSSVIREGQGTRVSQDGIRAAYPVGDSAASWRRGILFADNRRLGDLVQELARYWRGHLDVHPDVANLRVMGTYPLDEPERALGMLAEALPIRVSQPLPWWAVLKPASGH